MGRPVLLAPLLATLLALPACDRAGPTAPEGWPDARSDPAVAGAPTITLRTSYGDCVDETVASPGAVVFRCGLRFEWDAEPGVYGHPVVETAWALGDSPDWNLVDPSGTFPPVDEPAWAPDPGPTAFRVRARDSLGRERILFYALDVRVRDGRGTLVVFDADPATIVASGGLPPGYEVVGILDARRWIVGHAACFHPTRGTDFPVEPFELARATTVVWIHVGQPEAGDRTTLAAMFTGDVDQRSLLATWHAGGGNLLVCGTNPVDAMRIFDLAADCGTEPVPADPVEFFRTLADSTYRPHFAATQLGVDRVEHAWRHVREWPPESHLGTVRSALPWLPDLVFDPLKYPLGPEIEGFGYWDEGVMPRDGAVVAYTANATGVPVAVLRLDGPGTMGGSAYLGFHPYYVQAADVPVMFGALLDAFGERSTVRGPAPDPAH